MIKVFGHELWRNGEKIGYVYDQFIKNHDGDKIGYYQGDFIFDMRHKLAYVQGDYIHFLDSSHKIRIEDNNEEIVGGDLSNIQRAAVRILLGE